MSASPPDRQEPALASPLPEIPDNLYAPPRARVAKLSLRTGLAPHQKAGRVIRLMAWLGIVGVVGIGAAILLPAMTTGKPPPIELTLLIVAAAGLVAALFVVAGAVMRHATWGRYAGIAYGLISLPGIPIGSIVGLYIIWHLAFGWDDYDPED